MVGTTTLSMMAVESRRIVRSAAAAGPAGDNKAIAEQLTLQR
jgi:hypothetical protein